MFVEVQAWQDGRGGRSADQSALPCACFHNDDGEMQEMVGGRSPTRNILCRQMVCNQTGCHVAAEEGRRDNKGRAFGMGPIVVS
jgi:hypothetical protein